MATDIKSIYEDNWVEGNVAEGEIEYAYDLPQRPDQSPAASIASGIAIDPISIDTNPEGMTGTRQNELGEEQFRLYIKGFTDGTQSGDAYVKDRLTELQRLHKAFNAAGGNARYYSLYGDVANAIFSGPSSRRQAVMVVTGLTDYAAAEGGT